jgi:N-acetylglucosaminyl-diphospho-decaprenol L-rhamnosyltransferase
VTTIAVIMVTSRGDEALETTLAALGRARGVVGPSDRIITVIVDNASGDPTRERIRLRAPWADVVELPRNVGFAAGCNAGMRRAGQFDLVVLLNPDVEVPLDFFTLLTTLDWPSDIAARGPAIVHANGELEQSARGFPRARTGLFGRTSLLARVRPGSRLLRRDLVADLTPGPRVVDWVSGACMIVPAERFRSIGLLDERYFLYWEDADWCLRATLIGYRVLYDPRIVVVHHQGSSSQYRRLSARAIVAIIWFHRSAFRYWRKNVARSPISTTAAAFALALRCAFKLTALVVHRSINRLRTAEARDELGSDAHP